MSPEYNTIRLCISISQISFLLFPLVSLVSVGRMSNISMVEARLPPGFRFHPRDDELICDYLMRKLSNSDSLLLIEVNLNKCEPWDIPDVACVGGKEWYFYSHRDRKYATGLRTNRATSTGYWKATGKDQPVLRKGTLVGTRKTLVFYQGRAPRGCKTDWVMHEFGVHGSEEDWVLCRVFHKNKANDRGDGILPSTESSIAFDLSILTKVDEYEQVPCFSIFSQSQNGISADWESYSCYKKAPKAENNTAHLSVLRKSKGDRRAICPCPACGIITASKTNVLN